MRRFESGATRDDSESKLDFEGFIDPLVLEAYASYMHKHRKQADGQLRDSDNWQRGIPKDAYMKSAFRHLVDWWKQHRGHVGQDVIEESICALIFNAMGYLHELIKERQAAHHKPECGTKYRGCAPDCVFQLKQIDTTK